MDAHFARDYAKLMWQRAQIRKMCEGKKIITKLAAVAALPPKLREAAMMEDHTL
jgi:hypothetical protein